MFQAMRHPRVQKVPMRKMAAAFVGGLNMGRAELKRQPRPGRPPGGWVAKIVDGGGPAVEVRQGKTREKRILSSVTDEYAAALRRRSVVKADQVESALKRGLGAGMSREVDTFSRADFVGEIEKFEDGGKPREWPPEPDDDLPRLRLSS
jgi:hypothetical protein